MNYYPALPGWKTTPSGIYVPTTRESNIDMGEDANYRYLDTTSVPNSNSATYTATSRAASIDMGSTNDYRYVNTNSVPNTNSGTYTFAANDTGGTKDLGATNTYRYVNAGNVYTAGKKSQMSYELTFDLHVWTYARSSGAANIGAANVQHITLKIDGKTVFSNGVLSEASSDTQPVLYYSKTGNYSRS